MPERFETDLWDKTLAGEDHYVASEFQQRFDQFMRSLRGIANICLVLEYLILNNTNLLIAEKMPELNWAIIMIFGI